MTTLHSRTTIRMPVDDGPPVLGHVDANVPMEVRMRVNQAIAFAVAGKGVLSGERLPDLLKRIAPGALTAFAFEGYQVDVDLPQNTHETLVKGKIAVDIRMPQH